jgi:hypothetical protein
MTFAFERRGETVRGETEKGEVRIVILMGFGLRTFTF